MKLNVEQRRMIEILGRRPMTWMALRRYLVVVYGSQTRASEIGRLFDLLVEAGLVTKVVLDLWQLSPKGRRLCDRMDGRRDPAGPRKDDPTRRRPIALSVPRYEGWISGGGGI